MTNNSIPNEKELVIQLCQGSERAFTKIYKFYSHSIYCRILKSVKCVDDAKEIRQEVFVKIWQLRNTIEAAKSFRSYLYTITINAIKDFFRKGAMVKKVHQQLLKHSSEEYSHVEENFIYKENVLLLNRAIESLSPRRRKVFRLCKIEGKSYKEISEALNISTSTICQQIVEATHQIRKYFSLHT